MRFMRCLFMGIFLFISVCCFAKPMKIREHWRNHRSVELCPLQASFEESSKELLLQFQENWGTAEIVLIDPSGNTIYINTLEITECTYLAIPLDHLLEGEYKMCVKNELENIDREFFIY